MERKHNLSDDNFRFSVSSAGPVPVLDGENIVFGRVLEGLDTIGAISTVRRFLCGFERNYFEVRYTQLIFKTAADCTMLQRLPQVNGSCFMTPSRRASSSHTFFDFWSSFTVLNLFELVPQTFQASQNK